MTMSSKPKKNGFEFQGCQVLEISELNEANHEMRNSNFIS
jgi:hypothetical protein